MISLPLISHQDNTSCDTMCFQVAHVYMPWQQLHQEPICMAYVPMSSQTVLNVSLNPIRCPNVPYDVPTVVTYHPHSIFNFIPYICFATRSLWRSHTSHMSCTFVLEFYPNISFATHSLWCSHSFPWPHLFFNRIPLYDLQHVPYDVPQVPMCHPPLFFNFIQYVSPHVPYDVPKVLIYHLQLFFNFRQYVLQHVPYVVPNRGTGHIVSSFGRYQKGGHFENSKATDQCWAGIRKFQFIFLEINFI
jgi:hypothetical protein